MTVEECFDQVMEDMVPGNKGAWHEWATLKAALMASPKADAVQTYTDLFGTEPQELETAPKWLVVLACMWKGAEAGHKRVKRLFSGIDKQSLALLAKLDESALKLNKSLRTHIKSGNADILN